MSQNLRLALIGRYIFLSLSICLTTGLTLPNKPRAHLKAPPADNSGSGSSPVTSYYRHNIYGPNTYAFGFEVNDKASGNIQFRDEQRYGNGSVKGSYGYVRPDGSVSITHFMANPEQGYLSQTQNFEPEDKRKWLENWPTKKPSILMDKPLETIQPQVKYDEGEKLNLTSVLLPVEPIKAEHGIDLNPPDLEKELVNPAVLEVINGDVPLVANDGKKAHEIGFSTFNAFIHPDFPIITLELPNNQEGKGSSNNDEKPSSKSNKYNEQKVNNSEKILTDPDLHASPAEKYVKSKENNAEKSLPENTLRNLEEHHSSMDPSPSFKSRFIAKSLPVGSKKWYDRIISESRQEYLKDIDL
ncbi:uncharacterized protein LOC142233647 [Haematobia irritans]|uniref:uncharacterized protein LOC142233647 n=1 Tax=Haematobia irritans TaxID=7368 RepID=UPI003F502B6A